MLQLQSRYLYLFFFLMLGNRLTQEASHPGGKANIFSFKNVFPDPRASRNRFLRRKESWGKLRRTLDLELCVDYCSKTIHIPAWMVDSRSYIFPKRNKQVFSQHTGYSGWRWLACGGASTQDGQCCCWSETSMITYLHFLSFYYYCCFLSIAFLFGGTCNSIITRYVLTQTAFIGLKGRVSKGSGESQRQERPSIFWFASQMATVGRAG